MGGIKELMGLLLLLDGRKSGTVQKILSGKRPVSKEKAAILKDWTERSAPLSVFPAHQKPILQKGTGD